MQVHQQSGSGPTWAMRQAQDLGRLQDGMAVGHLEPSTGARPGQARAGLAARRPAGGLPWVPPALQHPLLQLHSPQPRRQQPSSRGTVYLAWGGR